MAEHESTMKFNVDVSKLKAAMQDAKRSISLANAEFKAATAGLDRWSKSTTGLEAKLKQLNSTLPQQRKILSELEKQYDLTAKEMGEDSAAAQKLQLDIEKQRGVINKTESQIDKYNNQLNEMKAEQEKAESASGKLTSTIDKQQKEVDDLKDAYRNAVLMYGENSEEAQKLATEIEDLSSELAENKSKMAEADKAADALDKSLDDVGDGAEDASSGFTVMKGALANLVADGIRMAVDGLKNFATETIEVGKNFDKSMANVAALSGATGKELEMLRDKAKEMGSSTQFSASEAADALGYMALAGWDANQSAEALDGVLNLAAASGMDLAKASDMVTDYMSAFNMETKDSAYFADLLAYAQANANTNVEQLGEAFKNSAANMNAAGQDVETTTSLLAMMANQGLKGSNAGTALSAVMRDLTAKMKDGAIQIGETSVEVMDANGNYRDMTDILRDVEAATDGMGDAEKAAALSSTFTADSIKGLNLILNAGVDDAAAFEEELRKSGGTAEETAKIMNDNLGGDLTALNSKLEGVQISIYEKFEPALRSGVDVLSALLDAVNFVVDHSGEFISAIGAMGAGIAAYVAYTTALKVMEGGFMALTVVQKAVTAAQWLMNAAMSANPIGLVVAAVAALVAGFLLLWKNSKSFRKFWQNLWKGIQKATGDTVDAIVQWMKDAWRWIQKTWDKAKPYFEKLWKAIKVVFNGVVTYYKTVFGTAWKVITTVWNVAVKFFTTIWNGIKGVFNGVVSFFKTTFQSAWNAITTIWNVAVTFFTTIWNGIKLVFSTVVSFFQTTFTNALNAIKTVWNTITAYFTGIWNGIKAVFASVSSWFGNIFAQAVNAIKNVFNTLKSFFSGIWTNIKNTFNAVGTWFKNKFNEGVNAIKGVFNGLPSFFSGLWAKIKGVFTNLGSQIGSAVGGAVKGAINGVISTAESVINSAIGLINGAIDLINKLPGVSVGKVGRVSFPRLAKGGVVDAATMALIGEDGAEAVVPLEKNRQWIAKVVKGMLEEMDVQGVKSAVGSITGGVNGAVNNITGATTQNVTFNQYNTSPKALDRLSIYRDTNNMLFAAKVGLKNV